MPEVDELDQTQDMMVGAMCREIVRCVEAHDFDGLEAVGQRIVDTSRKTKAAIKGGSLEH